MRGLSSFTFLDARSLCWIYTQIVRTQLRDDRCKAYSGSRREARVSRTSDTLSSAIFVVYVCGIVNITAVCTPVFRLEVLGEVRLEIYLRVDKLTKLWFHCYPTYVITKQRIM
jgi:hypothetical protein